MRRKVLHTPNRHRTGPEAGALASGRIATRRSAADEVRKYETCQSSPSSVHGPTLSMSEVRKVCQSNAQRCLVLSTLGRSPLHVALALYSKSIRWPKLPLSDRPGSPTKPLPDAHANRYFHNVALHREQ